MECHQLYQKFCTMKYREIIRAVISKCGCGYEFFKADPNMMTVQTGEIVSYHEHANFIKHQDKKIYVVLLRWTIPTIFNSEM